MAKDVYKRQEGRRYALTDENHRVLAVKTGVQLQSSDFIGLYPCTAYYAYELAMGANPTVGTILPDSVDPLDFGPPTRVTVPALGGNYQVGADSSEGKMRITIDPAAPNTLYGILDAEGNVIQVPGADEEDVYKRQSSHCTEVPVWCRDRCSIPTEAPCVSAILCWTAARPGQQATPLRS